MRLWLLLPLFSLFFSCNDTKPETEGSVPPPEKEPTLMVAVVDHLRLRDRSGPDGEVTASLREGETLWWTGDESAERETVTLRGREVTAPWYRVRTPGGSEGWVFGGALEVWKPGTGLPYGECLELFNRADLGGFYPCLERISRTASAPERVSVSPRNIRISLLDGGTRQLDHILTPGEDYRLYQYLGQLPRQQLHVVKVNRQGGSSFLAVHRQDGQMQELAGIPQPLPLGEAFFCLGPVPGEPGDQLLQVVAAGERGLRVMLEESFPDQSLAGIRWSTDGSPLIALRDGLGNLNTWKLRTKDSDTWQLEKQP